MRTQDRLFSQTLHAVLPLLIWAAHFFFCYVYAAAACRGGGGNPTLLVVASLAAVVVAVALLARAAWRTVNAGAPVRLLDWSTLVIASLALAGILWSSIPIAMLPC
jgi:hypothetical protein